MYFRKFRYVFSFFFRIIELERIYLFCYKGFYIPSIDSKEKLANFSDYRYFFLQEIIDILNYITFRNERLIFRVVYNYILNNPTQKHTKLTLLM